MGIEEMLEKHITEMESREIIAIAVSKIVRPLSLSMAIENFPKMAVGYFPPVFRFAFIPFSLHLC